jgi:phosphoglycolate phosphatase
MQFDVRKFIGPPLTWTFNVIFPNQPEKQQGALLRYRELYNAGGMFDNDMYEGIDEFAQGLRDKGIKVGVATSKLETQATMMLEHFNIAQHFQYITGSSLDERITKKHEVIEEALRRFNISSNREIALMIGDMKYDDIGAALVGVDCFGVYTGTAQPNEHEEAGATYIAYSFKELEDSLLGELYNS